MRFAWRSWVVVAVSLIFGAQSALAGEALRLKSGAISTVSSQMMNSLRLENFSETGLYIVQWKNAISESEKSEVSSLGFQFISYIPDDAFLVRGEKRAALNAQKLGFVRAVVPYHSGMKVEPELQKNGIFSFSQRVNVAIQTVDEVQEKLLQNEFEALKKVANGLFVGATTVGNVWKLAARNDVIWMERFLPVRSMDISVRELTGGVKIAPQDNPNAPYTGYESGTKIIHADAAWDAGFTGAGMLVAFADTGLDKGNMNTLIPDFRGQVKSAFAMGLGGKSWGDPQNHGTHVAGSIAGSGASSDGRIKGAAFGAKLVAEGLWSDILNNISIPGIPNLFQKAYSEGARLHSNSWGAPNSNGRYDTFAVQTDKWHFENQDFLAVFAAGNDGADLNKDGMIDEGTVSSPGSSKNVLTVGASKNYLLQGGIQRKMAELRDGKNKWGVEPIASSKLSEDENGMAAFSSRGPTADGRIKPEVVAPGTNIVSARNTNPKAKPEDSWGIYDEHYLYMGGTSMATPVTSGAMTVIRQFLLQKLHAQTVSGALMKATVANTAYDLFPGQFGLRSKGQEQPVRRPNNHQGWGRVDLKNLVESASLALYDETAGLSTGQEKTYSIKVQDTSHGLKVTMAYSDAPGTASASKTLVNDLDLVVIDPNGRTFFPNGKNAKDSTNNMEQVDVLTPAKGEYTVKVRAANIPQGRNGAQPFALVVSGF